MNLITYYLPMYVLYVCMYKSYSRLRSKLKTINSTSSYYKNVVRT